MQFTHLARRALRDDILTKLDMFAVIFSITDNNTIEQIAFYSIKFLVINMQV